MRTPTTEKSYVADKMRTYNSDSKTLFIQSIYFTLADILYTQFESISILTSHVTNRNNLDLTKLTVQQHHTCKQEVVSGTNRLSVVTISIICM